MAVAGKGWSMALAATLLGACSSTPPPPPSPPAPVPPPVPHVAKAEAALAPASASLVSGRLVLVTQPQAVRITGTIGGLRPGGSFGFHIHERGDCSAVDASSAGDHFNPGGAPHGRATASTPHHLGDLDNLVADGEGVVQIDLLLRGVALGGGGADNILGRSLVVHAAPDDYRSQPAGNTGARLACGVIKIAR